MKISVASYSRCQNRAVVQVGQTSVLVNMTDSDEVINAHTASFFAMRAAVKLVLENSKAGESFEFKVPGKRVMKHMQGEPQVTGKCIEDINALIRMCPARISFTL